MDQDFEATHSYVSAAPGRVFTRLLRITPDGTVTRGMHAEFTPAQAQQIARHLDECAKEALTLTAPPQSNQPELPL